MANSEKVLLDFYNQQTPVQHFNWLQGRSFSEAFVICIGAGPWKFDRRKKIQGEALDKLGNRDINELSRDEASRFYPLEWQNEFLTNSVKSLQDVLHWSFDYFCEDLITRTKTKGVFFGLDSIYDLTQCSGSPKVLSLFCRDALQIPSFPIDRHVKRKLIELGLPTNERKMISLCFKVGINPSDAAVAFVRAASDMDNPDWSVNEH